MHVLEFHARRTVTVAWFKGKLHSTVNMFEFGGFA